MGVGKDLPKILRDLDAGFDQAIRDIYAPDDAEEDEVSSAFMRAMKPVEMPEGAG